MFFVVLFGVFLSCHSFLLDGDTKTPTDGTALSDKRYNTLMDLLMEERRSRTKLESAVTRELLALKQEVVKCQCGSSNIGTQQTNNKNVFETNETKALKEDFLNLQRDYNALKVQFVELVKNNSAVNVRVHQVEQGLSSIKQPQSVDDFHNETKHLEKALQITNNKLNVVTNDVNARKQDFIALFNRVQKTEQLLENKTKSLETRQNVTTSGFQQQFITLSQKVQETEKQLENKTKSLEVSQNVTTSGFRQQFITLSHKIQETGQLLENKTKSLEVSQNVTTSHLRQEILKEANLEARQNQTSTKLQQQTHKLQQELDKMANRVALTTCKDNDAVNNVIQFTNVKTVNGINNLTSIRKSGIFTCEKSGIYLISVFIQTNKNHGQFVVKKNTDTIADGYTSLTEMYETTSVTLIQQLDVNDNISVTGNLLVYGNYESCLTIVQIK